MSKDCKYFFTKILETPYEGPPPWRQYEFISHGNKWSEVLENMHIREVGEDGKDLGSYAVCYAPEYIEQMCYDYIEKQMKNSSEYKSTLNPDTGKLNVRSKWAISMANTSDFYEVLNCLFKEGFGPFTEKDIYEIKAYLDRISNQ